MPDRRANPYVGPRPFASTEADRFFGRTSEACELLSLILAYPLTVLYSESGAGKTSLLNATIIPELQRQECDVIGPLRVAAELPNGFTPPASANIYTLTTMLFLERDASEPAVLERLSRTSLTEHLRERPRKPTPHAIRPPRVLAFDQFEELFTARPDRWRDREGFFADIGDALVADPRLRVVLSMREEFLASVEPFLAQLPEGFSTRFHLSRLGMLAALEAIENPVRGTGISFDAGAAQRLVDNLLQLPPQPDGSKASAEHVEPMHLQVVCQRIWNAVADDATSISVDDVATTGAVDSALTDYYDTCMKQLAADLKQSEGRLRTWFERNFITAEGTRSLVYRTLRQTGGLPNDIVEAMQRVYLVRAERRGTSRWYEIAHDRLIGPIVTSNASWRREHDASAMSADVLELRARQWRDAGRPPLMLLGSSELARLHRSHDGDSDAVDYSDLLREYLSASEMAVERRHARRVRRQLLMAVAVLVFIVVAAVWDEWRRGNARLEERAEFAKLMLKRDVTRLDGLLFALRTHGKPTFNNAYSELLRGALRGIGRPRWLRHTDTNIHNALFSPAGDRVLTIADKELCIWPTAALSKSDAQCIDAPRQHFFSEAFFARSGNAVIARIEPELSERRKTFDSDEPPAVAKFAVWGAGSCRNFSKTCLFVVALGDDVQQHDASLTVNDKWLGVITEKVQPKQSPGTNVSARLIRVFDIARRVEEPSRLIMPPTTWYHSLSPNGTRLMTVDENAVRIWDRATGALIQSLNTTGQDRPIVKWFNDDRLFVGFRIRLFQPTLVTISGNGVVRKQLETANVHVLDALFDPTGRLLVSVFNEGPYIFDPSGNFEQKLPHETADYVTYAQYFNDGSVMSVDKSPTCRITLINDKVRHSVDIPARFEDLTYLSAAVRRVLSVSNGVARVWSFDDRDLNLDKMSDAELVAVSCAKLKQDPILWREAQKEQVCQQTMPEGAALSAAHLLR